MQGAVGGVGRLADAVVAKKLMRTLGEQATHFAALAFDQRNPHLIVAGRLMAQPRDGGGLGAFLDRDALGAGNGAAAHRSRVGRDQVGEELGVGGVVRVKSEEGKHGRAEIFDVIGLGDGAAAAAGGEATLVGGIGALGRKFGAEGGDAVGRGPDAPGETLAAFELDHGPRRTVGLDAPAQGGVAGREQGPTGGHGLESGALVEDMTGLLAGTDFAGRVGHRVKGQKERREHKAQAGALRAGVGRESGVQWPP